MTTGDLARFMFDQQADMYDADPAMRELAWADEGIVEFWYEQATAILDFIDVRRGESYNPNDWEEF